MNKHLKSVLPIIEQVIKDAVFPEDELIIHLTNKKQKFHVNNQKVATIARKKFAELIFGEEHPYGINTKESHFDDLKRDDLISFHKSFYNSKNCKIIVAGYVKEDINKLLDIHFGGDDWNGDDILEDKNIEIFSSPLNELLIEKPDAIQSAIRVGKLTFNKTHKDFHPLLVLNTVYGGLFWF